MKKLFIVLGIIFVAMIGIAVWWKLRTAPQVQNNQTQTTFPQSNSDTAKNGGTLEIKDFLSDPQTKEDQANKGYYFLGNQPDVPNPYVIVYIADTHYLNISLLQEPIGKSRTEAENYLLEHFRLSKDQLCSLDYTLTVPDFVNSTYSDENLGFSFCPGAVVLP